MQGITIFTNFNFLLPVFIGRRCFGVKLTEKLVENQMRILSEWVGTSDHMQSMNMSASNSPYG